MRAVIDRLLVPALAVTVPLLPSLPPVASVRREPKLLVVAQVRLRLVAVPVGLSPTTRRRSNGRRPGSRRWWRCRWRVSTPVPALYEAEMPVPASGAVTASVSPLVKLPEMLTLMPSRVVSSASARVIDGAIHR